MIEFLQEVKPVAFIMIPVIFIMIIFCLIALVFTKSFEMNNCHITQYNNGIVVAQYDGDNVWKSSSSNTVSFLDKKTGKEKIISGEFIIQEK